LSDTVVSCCENPSPLPDTVVPCCEYPSPLPDTVVPCCENPGRVRQKRSVSRDGFVISGQEAKSNAEITNIISI
jgi:hypothetical protein